MSAGANSGPQLDLEAVAVALLFALASAMPVALTLQSPPNANSAWTLGEIDWQPIGTSQALVLALGAVIPAGLVGGAVGSWVRRRRPAVGVVAALAVGWFVGIVMLPVVASAAGIALRDAIVCDDACRPLLRDAPLSGLAAYGETLLFAIFSAPYLIIPGALLLLARLLRHPVLWVATGVSAHAVIHLMSIDDHLVPYLLLVSGVLAWGAWLWARDAGVGPFRRPSRRLAIAVLFAASAVGLASPNLAGAWVPTVPGSEPATLVGRIVLDGATIPVAGGQSLFRPPPARAGEGCFDPIDAAAGRIVACWSATLVRRPSWNEDAYHVRLETTVIPADAPGPRWIAMDLVADGHPNTRLRDVWPEGVIEGPCRLVGVDSRFDLAEMVAPNAVEPEELCGRTSSIRANGQRHRVIWTCVACSPSTPDRRLVIHDVIATNSFAGIELSILADAGY